MPERKTAYVFGERRGPDVPALVAQFPKRCTVTIDDNSYKYMQCCSELCLRWYWRMYRRKSVYVSTANSGQTYCSEECAAVARRKLRKQRNARYYAKPGVRDRHNTQQSASKRRKRAQKKRLKSQRRGQKLLTPR
jgi:hypothetical protein